MITMRRYVLAVPLMLGTVVSGPMNAATLDEAVQMTIDTNPDVLINVNNRRAREQELKQAQAGYKPSLDFNAGYGYERSNNPTTRSRPGDGDEDLSRRETGLTLRQMVFDGFATKSEVERQRARIDSAAYRIQGDAEKTALRAAEVYLEVLRQDELERITSDNLDAHRRILSQIKLRSEQGVGRRADLDQVQARVSLAESNLVAAGNNVVDAASNYLRVIGDMPEGLSLPPARDDLPRDPDEAVSEAISNNPTLKSAMVDVTATMAQHRAAKRTYLPRVDVELSRNWDDDLDGARGANHDAQAMLRMRWNLYNGGADTARRMETAHLISEASEVRNRTCRQVVESMRLSFEAFEKLTRQVEYLQRYREFADTTRKAYTQQFNIGQRTLLDVLDSENELFVATRDVINASYDRHFAQYRMLAASGRLVSALGVRLPPESVPITNTTFQPMGHCEWRPASLRKSAQESAHTANKVTTMPAYVATAGTSIADGEASAEPASVADVRPDVGASTDPIIFSDAGEGPEGDRESLLLALERWADAWSSQDSDRYLSFYSDEFVPLTAASRSEWEAQRRERLVTPAFIKVSISYPRVRWRSEERATVEFVQRYESDSYSDEVTKTLVLASEAGEWKITSEASAQ